jgi:hypothetical protein
MGHPSAVDWFGTVAGQRTRRAAAHRRRREVAGRPRRSPARDRPARGPAAGPALRRTGPRTVPTIRRCRRSGGATPVPNSARRASDERRQATSPVHAVPGRVGHGRSVRPPGAAAAEPRVVTRPMWRNSSSRQPRPITGEHRSRRTSWKSAPPRTGPSPTTPVIQHRRAPAGRRPCGAVTSVGILSRVSGVLADAALGLPLRATPYTVQRAVPVAMPDRGDAPR